MLTQVMNSKGQPIVLNEQAAHSAKWAANEMWRRFGPRGALKNSLGYEVAITTLTGISTKISEQKFYKIPVADYVPTLVGENPFTTNITTFRSFQVGDEFEDGIIDTGGDNSRLASVDAAVDALNIKVFNWAKSLGYTIFDLEFASRNGNWDLVEAKEISRKTNWDLGIQRVAFLGARGSNAAGGSCLGLLNQTGITTNTSVITQSISTMTTDQLKTFQSQVVKVYRMNNNYTVYPNRFMIPEDDYNGLASQSSPTFPMKTTLALLEEAFKITCQAPDFKILPSAYANPAMNGGVNQYVLYNHDYKSLKMEVPLQYVTTLANSLDNFGFQNVGMGQWTGVLVLRPLEMMYFTF